MLAQYNAQRFRYEPRGPRMAKVGTVPIGTMFRLSDHFKRDGMAGPWIVDAWTNREYHPGFKGGPVAVYLAGGHLAECRNLRTGKRARIADHLIRHAIGD